MNAPALAALREGWSGFDGRVNLAPLGEGHINDTFLVTVADGSWVLQRLNVDVFTTPERVVANTDRVLAHLAGTTIPTATLLPTREGKSAHVSSDGGWWRIWTYVRRARTLRAVSVAEAQAAGAAFGRLQRCLADLPGPVLEPTIAGFMQLAGYLDALDEARQGHAAGVAEQVGFVDARRDLATQLAPRGDYIHADCKINNLLFAEDGPEVVAVLDLDTVMPGHWAWDFGDLARSIAAGAEELPVELICAAARGFLEGRGEAAGLGTLLDAPRYVALMLGVRFLSDHLCGDVYFKVRGRGENLERANRQFALVAQLEAHRRQLEAQLVRLPGVTP